MMGEWADGGVDGGIERQMGEVTEGGIHGWRDDGWRDGWWMEGCREACTEG